MATSISGNGPIKTMLTNWAARLDTIFIKFIVIPAFSIVIPAYLVYALKQSPPQQTVTFFDTLILLTHTYPYLIVGIIALATICNNLFVKLIESHKHTNSGINVEALTALCKIFDEIIGPKAKRFAKCAGEIYTKKNRRNTETIFNEITQPEQQISLMPQGIHSFFDHINSKRVDLYVTIVKNENNEPIGWIDWSPQNKVPQVAISILNHKESSVSCCIKNKKMIIIEDIQAEAAKERGRQYVAADDTDESGSLLCYPVIHLPTESIPYVITIQADQKGYFNKQHRKIYVWILDQFAARIRLEHSLLYIKNNQG